MYILYRTEAEPLVKGLGNALYQGFGSFDKALEEYLKARDKDQVCVIRSLSDVDAEYGDKSVAEDLPEMF